MILVLSIPVYQGGTMNVLLKTKLIRLAFSMLMLLSALPLVAVFIQPAQATRAADNWLHASRNTANLQASTNELLAYQSGAFLPAVSGYNDKGTQLPSMYLLKLAPTGFLIMSADDNSVPVLAYSGSQDIVSASFPPNFLDWVASYNDQITELRSQKTIQPANNQAWQSLLNGLIPQREITRSVQPLLSTNWDQGWPYNELCPSDNAGPGGHVYAGCVATAMSMVMKYWNHPATGVGNNSYYAVGYGYQSANFGATTYLWDEMPDALGGSNLPVATLLYHCGVSVNMGYAPDGSGAQSADAADAFVDHFRYPQAEIVSKSNYSAANWNALLKAQIDNGSPMYYSGSGTGGHAFVIDGYDTADYFHFNFGWSGSYNGYFYTTSICPGGSDFSQWQAAIINTIPENYSIANTKVRMQAAAPTVGENFNLKLTTNPILGSWNVNHYEFNLHYNQDFVNYVDYSVNSTISAGGNVTVTNPEPGVLAISWNGSTRLIGGGDLINLTFMPLDQGEYLFDISDMKYNTSAVNNTMYLMVNALAPVASLEQSHITMSNIMHLGFQQVGSSEIRTSYLLPSWNVQHFHANLTFDPAKLEFVGLDTAGTLCAGNNAQWVVNSPGNISLSCDTAAQLVGSGVLIKVQFRGIGNTSSLSVTQVALQNFFYNATQITAPGSANVILSAIVSVDDDLLDPVPHLLVSPNPVISSANLEFCGKQNVPAMVKIYNLKGQLVKSFSLDHPTKNLSWDTRDDHGRYLATGVYFISWQQGATTGRNKILILK